MVRYRRRLKIFENFLLESMRAQTRLAQNSRPRLTRVLSTVQETAI